MKTTSVADKFRQNRMRTTRIFIAVTLVFMKLTLKISMLAGVTAFALLSQSFAQSSSQIDFSGASASSDKIEPATDCADSNSALASAFGNGCFVKVDSNGKLRCSLDGIHWDS